MGERLQVKVEVIFILFDGLIMHEILSNLTNHWLWCYWYYLGALKWTTMWVLFYLTQQSSIFFNIYLFKTLNKHLLCSRNIEFYLLLRCLVWILFTFLHWVWQKVGLPNQSLDYNQIESKLPYKTPNDIYRAHLQDFLWINRLNIISKEWRLMSASQDV